MLGIWSECVRVSVGVVVLGTRSIKKHSAASSKTHTNRYAHKHMAVTAATVTVDRTTHMNTSHTQEASPVYSHAGGVVPRIKESLVPPV